VGARLPGSRLLAARAKAAREGLRLSDALINEINSL
jgi:LDH2 family malate/lactate/ureidoglycolate dehydrogenase